MTNFYTYLERNIGSSGGLAAATRGECDIAPIICSTPQSGEYNGRSTPELELVPGCRRLQGIVFRKGDPRFEGRSLDAAIAAALGFHLHSRTNLETE